MAFYIKSVRPAWLCCGKNINSFIMFVDCLYKSRLSSSHTNMSPSRFDVVVVNVPLDVSVYSLKNGNCDRHINKATEWLDLRRWGVYLLEISQYSSSFFHHNMQYVLCWHVWSLITCGLAIVGQHWLVYCTW